MLKLVYTYISLLLDEINELYNEIMRREIER